MNKKKLFFLCGLLMTVLLITSCATTTRTVTRTAVDTQTDYSGRWNDTDSKLVAEQMIKELIYRPWLSDFVSKYNKKPVVIVGNIRNLSSEHIETLTFIKDIERELINSGKVKFVATSNERRNIRTERLEQQSYASDATAKSLAEETGADFMLIGTLKSNIDSIGGKEARFYKIDLELIDIETNEKAWIGSKEIKKVIQKAKTKW
ncbi:MAG: penicillin-binding protein activator LpoB [Bacteroidetes bacterium]|nr:MAG: penicillin-binding protein activator LpoB [Bacteroidota bacterium]